MEYWSNGDACGRIIFSLKAITPMLHDSNTPIGAKPLYSSFYPISASLTSKNQENPAPEKKQGFGLRLALATCPACPAVPH